jgi:hypothetical protein
MNIDDSKRSRDALKGYFVKNAIPTEGQFAQLIDSGLNQREDRLVKPLGGPLSIEATGPESGPRKVLDFYDNLAEAQPTFSLGLRMKPNDARRGLTVSDGAGNARLAIEATSGNVGIGTTEPKQRLDIAGDIGFFGRQALIADASWLRLNQAGHYASGTLTPGLFAPMSLNVGGLNNWSNPGNTNAVIAGSLGVAVFAPADRLHVDGRIRAGAMTMGPWPANPGNYAFVGSNLLDQSDQKNYALLVGTEAEPGVTYLNARNAIGFRIGNVPQMLLTAEGRFGIGINNPSQKLHVSGPFLLVNGAGNEQVYIGGDGAGGDAQFGSLNAGVGNAAMFNPASGQYMALFARQFVPASDAALKTEIEPLVASLDAALQLRPVSFLWRGDEADGRRQLGFIAQQVRDVLPEAVIDGGRGKLGLHYDGVVAVLAGALQELAREVAALKARLAERPA